MDAQTALLMEFGTQENQASLYNSLHDFAEFSPSVDGRREKEQIVFMKLDTKKTLEIRLYSSHCDKAEVEVRWKNSPSGTKYRYIGTIFNKRFDDSPLGIYPGNWMKC